METIQSKRDRFKRLAAKRTNEVIRKLDILEHCANKHSYDYSAEEVKQIFLAIEKKLNEVRSKFKTDAEPAFRL